mmetsp:Transcript_18280/g.26684  ORF Transcript_18280/g.26684 Transcript_18280/m.26684 type:complete len:215 (+) Transcript_18280:236-880(+)
MVALHSSLILSSFSASHFHGTRYNPTPGKTPASSPSRASFISWYVAPVAIPLSRRSTAALYSSCCISSRPVEAAEAASSRLVAIFPSFPARYLNTHSPLATSRGPSSILNGTPFLSHSKYLAPLRKLSRSSTFTLSPDALSPSTRLSNASSNAALPSTSLFFGWIGTMTTCTGATFGGKTRPASSECVIINAPMRRVDTPHDDPHTSLSFPSLS